ncbi:MAG: hypothetical protein U9N81_07020, partial [Bacillota bacterium]|nr:hypothetical protein [Bacillota bacterium]
MLKSLFMFDYANNLFREKPNYQKLQRFLIHPIDSINEVVLRKQQMKLENYRSYLDFSNPE